MRRYQPLLVALAAWTAIASAASATHADAPAPAWCEPGQKVGDPCGGVAGWTCQEPARVCPPQVLDGGDGGGEAADGSTPDGSSADAASPEPPQCLTCYLPGGYDGCGCSAGRAGGPWLFALFVPAWMLLSSRLRRRGGSLS